MHTNWASINTKKKHSHFIQYKTFSINKENASSDILWAKAHWNVRDTSYLVSIQPREVVVLFPVPFLAMWSNGFMRVRIRGCTQNHKQNLVERMESCHIPPKGVRDGLTSPNDMQTRTQRSLARCVHCAQIRSTNPRFPQTSSAFCMCHVQSLLLLPYMPCSIGNQSA